jgi:acyl dehydratase
VVGAGRGTGPAGRLPTRRDQALPYRLSGDRNPLHSDPAVAGADPDRLAGLSGRFTGVLYPGDTLVVSVWRRPRGAVFRTAASTARSSSTAASAPCLSRLAD